MIHNVKPAAGADAENFCGDFVGRVFFHFGAALDTESLAAAREEEAEVIVNFGSGGNGGARVACGIFLPNGHGRSDAGDFVDVGLFHALEKLARVGGEGFDVAALALGVDGVEGQGRFAGAADAADDGNGVMRNFDGDVLQVMDAGAADAERLLIQLAWRGLGKGFVFCQEGA